jgi:hypothetical protein
MEGLESYQKTVCVYRQTTTPRHEACEGCIIVSLQIDRLDHLRGEPDQ